MAFDLFKTDVAQLAEDGYTFAVKTPDGVDTDWKIHVRGSQSKIVKDYARKLFQKIQTQTLRDQKRGKEREFDLDEAELQAVENAVLRIKGWEGLAFKGEPVPFTEAKAKELLLDLDWVRKQVLEESENEANFI